MMVLGSVLLRVFVYGLVILIQPGSDDITTAQNIKAVLLESDGTMDCHRHVPFILGVGRDCREGGQDPQDPECTAQGQEASGGGWGGSWSCNGLDLEEIRRLADHQAFLRCLDPSGAPLEVSISSPSSSSSSQVSLYRTPVPDLRYPANLSELADYRWIPDLSKIARTPANRGESDLQNVAATVQFDLRATLEPWMLARTRPHGVDSRTAPVMHFPDHEARSHTMVESVVFETTLPQNSEVQVKIGQETFLLSPVDCGQDQCVDVYIGNLTAANCDDGCECTNDNAEHFHHYWMALDYPSQTQALVPEALGSNSPTVQLDQLGTLREALVKSSLAPDAPSDWLPNPWVLKSGMFHAGYGSQICPLAMN